MSQLYKKKTQKYYCFRVPYGIIFACQCRPQEGYIRKYYNMPLFSKTLSSLSLVILVLALSGCSEPRPDGMPPLHPVSLTFTQEGEPLEGATVALFSQDDPDFQWAVGGSTDRNGVAVLKTHGTYTGAPEGRYIITVRKFVREGELQTMDNPGAPPPRDYNLVDEQFANRNNSTLVVEIKRGNRYEPFDLGPAVKELLRAPGM